MKPPSKVRTLCNKDFGLKGWIPVLWNFEVILDTFIPFDYDSDSLIVLNPPQNIVHPKIFSQENFDWMTFTD